jgi:hypothetical protein
MSESTKDTYGKWTHIDALMKAGGQITLGRMAPLDGVAVAGDDHNLYAALRRRPDETVSALATARPGDRCRAKRRRTDQRNRRQSVRPQAAEHSQKTIAVKGAKGPRLPTRSLLVSLGALLKAAKICQEPIFRAGAGRHIHGLGFAY